MVFVKETRLTNGLGKIFGTIFVCSALILSTGNAHAQTETKPAAKQEQAKIPAKKPTGNWSVFRGNSQSTGVADSQLPDELDILWQYKVTDGSFEGSPVIVMDHDAPMTKTVYIGDLDGKLYALDLENGSKRWEFNSENGFATAPAVSAGRIFIGDVSGNFFCLDNAGKKLWNFQTDSEINSSANFYDGKVLFGSQDSFLYALDQETGTLAWKFESPDQIRCSATIAGDRAFVAGCDGYFHVIDLKQGTGVGKADINSPAGTTPAALGDLVFFGTEQGDFFAIDWRQITIKWTHSEPQSGNSIRCSAAVNEQHVVFGGQNRIVYSLNPQTGEKNWSVTLKAKIEASPVIVGDRVFVASTDGRLYALSLQDGKILWEKQFTGQFNSSPAVAFGRLVVATDRGVVYCLGKK